MCQFSSLHICQKDKITNKSKVRLRYIWLFASRTLDRQFRPSVHRRHNFCCAYTRRTSTSSGLAIILFSQLIIYNSAFILSVLYLSVTHNLKKSWVNKNTFAPNLYILHALPTLINSQLYSTYTVLVPCLHRWFVCDDGSE
jgi:hypothetical protein